MLLTLRVVIGLTVFSPFSYGAQPESSPVGASLYHETKATIHALIEKGIDPETTYFIALGRSPTPVAAFLEILQPGCVSYIPLSAFRFGVDGYRRLSPEEKTRLWELLDQTFPSDQTISGRRVVIFDFGVKGTQLASLSAVLPEYLLEKRRLVDFETLAFVRPGAVLPFQPTLGVIELHGDLAQGMYLQKFDEFAPFESFRIEGTSFSSKPPQTNSVAYQRFLEGMQFHLKSDQDQPTAAKIRARRSSTFHGFKRY